MLRHDRGRAAHLGMIAGALSRRPSDRRRIQKRGKGTGIAGAFPTLFCLPQGGCPVLGSFAPSSVSIPSGFIEHLFDFVIVHKSDKRDLKRAKRAEAPGRASEQRAKSSGRRARYRMHRVTECRARPNRCQVVVVNSLDAVDPSRNRDTQELATGQPCAGQLVQPVKLPVELPRHVVGYPDVQPLGLHRRMMPTPRAGQTCRNQGPPDGYAALCFSCQFASPPPRWDVTFL